MKFVYQFKYHIKLHRSLVILERFYVEDTFCIYPEN